MAKYVDTSRKITNSRWSLVRKYFTIKDKHLETASCNLCGVHLSYRCTANLIKHMQRLHFHAFKRDRDRNRINRIKPLRKMRKRYSVLWNYFIRNGDRFGRCIICRKNVSYKSTTWNLKQHLQIMHIRLFDKLNKELDRSKNKDSEEDDESSKQPELWTYFDREGDGARCVICETTFEDFTPDDLKAHMLATHPKIMEQVARQESGQVGELSSEGEEFKEVVYLEAESSPEAEPEVKFDTLATQYHPETSSIRKKIRRIQPKRKRDSTSSDENPKKILKPPSNDDELDAFTTYIKCLLKKLPVDVFQKVQLDIVNVILNARNNHTNNSFNNGYIVLDGKTIPGGVAVSLADAVKDSGSLTNYNITVTPNTSKAEEK